MPPRVRRDRWSKAPAASKAAELFPSAVEKNEAAFQSEVNKYATRVGLWWWHDAASNHLAAKGDARRNKKGFLDCFFVGGWVMLRELKTDKGVVSPEQRELILRLEKAGADVGVWRQADWKSGKCQEEMDACAKAAKSGGKVALPNVPKLLFLMNDSLVREAGGLPPRAGADRLWPMARGIDRELWREQSRSLMRAIGHSLPATDAAAAAWLAAHGLASDATATQMFEALRRDFLGTAAGEGNDVAA